MLKIKHKKFFPEEETSMKQLQKGDLCKVIKSKYITPGTTVEIMDELGAGIYLCGTTSNENYIVVAKNLIPIEEVA